ncbi:MAG: metallophosphoesterase family protein [Spirochaetales bacterium]|nr:metallophosphoesterase family protein [Spirochaetales bacterium]
MRLIIVALCLLLTGTGCITTAAKREYTTDPPILSWHGDPSTSMAIGWFDVPGVLGVDLRGSGGETVSVDAEYLGPVSRVLLNDLNPGSTYEYRVRLSEGSSNLWRSFTTVWSMNPSEEYPMDSGGGSLSFAVVGDLQPHNLETVRTTSLGIQKVTSLGPAFILQLGDVAENGISRRSWRLAASVLSEARGEIPFVMTAGNHDYSYILPSARYFKNLFPAPYADNSSKRRNTWYSMTIASVHIAVLDTEAAGRRFHTQIDWLKEDLATAREAGARWLFISMHRPLLSTATAPGNARWARELLPLAGEYGVDAVFWGHDHLFEHYLYQYGLNGYVFSPTDDVAVEPTHLFTVGTLGARVDPTYVTFFFHPPYIEKWDLHERETGSPITLEFVQRPWNRDKVKHDMPGIRYSDPGVYPRAGSYYSYPFDSAEDAKKAKYAQDPEIRYSGDAEFFGYTFGESSIHYLWIEVHEDRCIISAHYIDGQSGEHGSIIESPDGAPQRWVLR